MPAPAPASRHLRAAEVATELGCSPRTVHYLISREGLPAIRLGRAFRIPAEELRQWLESRHTGHHRSAGASQQPALNDSMGDVR